jgi:GntR family transcriptional regulator
LAETFGVSIVTARQAIAQLRAEGLVRSRVGSGVYVTAGGPPRRMSEDILRGEAFYKSVGRLGLQASVATSVSRAPASEEVAEALEVPPGAEVLVHERLGSAEGGPPIFLATNYFPLWVVERVPQLAKKSTSGLTKHLGEAYGDLYGEDLIDSRMPTPEERERLEIPENTPVTVIKGLNRDGQLRALHYIEKVTVAGRTQYGYRFGIVPEG